MGEELKVCPFCGGEAEMDTQQAYRNIRTGHLETAIAIYCLGCGAHHSICRRDVPDAEPEMVIELWNRRSPPSEDQIERGARAFDDLVQGDGVVNILDRTKIAKAVLLAAMGGE